MKQKPAGVHPMKSRSLQAACYAQMREDIIRLELAPGERLQLERLAERYSVSHQPIRQAIAQLQTEGFVRTEPHRGAWVAPLIDTDLELIQSVREGVEGRLARLAVQNMTAATIRQLDDVMQRLGVLPPGEDFDRLLALSLEFRDTLYARADREELHACAIEWRARLERYLRAISNPYSARYYLSNLGELLEACRVGDAAGAELATRESIEWTLTQFREQFASEPDAPVPDRS